jgi:hypothetical protein
MKIFWIKSIITLCKLKQIVFVLVQNKIIFTVVKFVATKKGKTTNFFASFFVAVVGS